MRIYRKSLILVGIIIILALVSWRVSDSKNSHLKQEQNRSFGLLPGKRPGVSQNYELRNGAPQGFLRREQTAEPIKAVPDLKGGPEFQNRTTAHNPALAHVLYAGAQNEKLAALTFDDGPDTVFTPQILNILRDNHIKATFFIVGTRAQAHPEMVQRIAGEGHTIGNHTWDHADLARLPYNRVISEVQQTEQLLYKILGYNTALFRPPYGAASAAVVRDITSLGYNVIDWSVDTRDWAGTPVQQIMQYVNSEIRPGGIILEHCAGGRGENLSNTVQALPQIISTLKSQGYRFVNLPDLLHISASKY